MRNIRLYCSDGLATEKIILLSPEAARHAVRVLRMQIGDSLILFNGKGGEYTGEIISIKKDSVEVQIKSFTARDVESPLKIHLGQGLLRNEKMDLVIQKAVELGVHAITPLLTERVSISLKENQLEKRLERWHTIIQSACEQCGRNTLPSIEQPRPLHEWIKGQQHAVRLVLYPQSTQTLRDITQKPTSISLLIGPEGGLSPQEIQLAERTGFLGLKLGPRVLRTETAALTAITVVQSRWGEFL